MSNKRNNKHADKNNESGRLLLKKQQISRASLGGVTGGGEVSALASGALSAIGSASSSLETPSGAVSGTVSGALSAYDSNHLEDKIKHGVGKAAKGAGHAAKKAGSWIKHHISF